MYLYCNWAVRKTGCVSYIRAATSDYIAVPSAAFFLRSWELRRAPLCLFSTKPRSQGARGGKELGVRVGFGVDGFRV